MCIYFYHDDDVMLRKIADLLRNMSGVNSVKISSGVAIARVDDSVSSKFIIQWVEEAFDIKNVHIEDNCSHME